MVYQQADCGGQEDCYLPPCTTALQTPRIIQSSAHERNFTHLRSTHTRTFDNLTNGVITDIIQLGGGGKLTMGGDLEEFGSVECRPAGMDVLEVQAQVTC